MKFAVIGDIHSNKFALESVLEDIRTRDVDFVISTGDLVGYLPFPNEVIKMIRENKVLVVQGNHDKAIADSDKVEEITINNITMDQVHAKASSVFTNWIITDENRKYLKNLQSRLKMNCGGLEILIVHGSHRAIDEYLYEDKENLTQISDTLEEDVLICGHTHIPYHFEIDKKHFINVGSVGKPKHGDSKATYVIINIEDNTVESETIKVSYDISKMVKVIEENPMISNRLIDMLEGGY